MKNFPGPHKTFGYSGMNLSEQKLRVTGETEKNN